MISEGQARMREDRPHVILTPAEYVLAATAGVHRASNALAKQIRSLYGQDPADSLRHHITGALGECAVAKHFGVYWSGIEHFAPDVLGFEVRTTPKPDGCLLLHDRDPDAANFVLVIVCRTACTLAGVIRAADGKRPEWWKEYRPGGGCYYVPQSALQPVPATPGALAHTELQWGTR